jgi:chromosome partition protein MukB
MKLFRAYAKRLVLANWKGIIFHCFDLDRYVTGLEGQNGAGKTTVMAAYVTAILPNQRLLSFKNIGGSAPGARGDGGLWGRLGEDGICYSLIEWLTPRGKKIWAGVAMTRGGIPSIDIKPVIIHDLPADANPYDLLLLREGGNAIVPSLARLREHVAMHGGRLIVQKSLADYMKVLFDHGITPMPMATHDEQERFYRVLSTSMEGSALGTLIKTGLRDYLFSPDVSLERRVSLMRESLEQCRQTKRELERAQQAHAEISEMFDAAWKMSSYAFFGARGRYEQETRNWQERVSINKDTKEQYSAHEAKVGHLQRRAEELALQLAAAEATLQARKSDLQKIGEARALRTALELATEEQCRLERNAEQVQTRRDATEAAEELATQGLQHAQDEYTRIAEELGNTQKAVEGLIRRVTELHVARTLLADARRAMQPDRLDRDNAVSVKQRLDRHYDEETRRQTDAQAELDALNDHLARFDSLLGKLRVLAKAEQWHEPTPATAYGQALALEAKLREHRAQSERIDSLEGELARGRDAATQQAGVHERAAELGIASSDDLAEKLVTADAQLEQLESEHARVTSEIGNRQDSVVEAKGRLPALQELARRYSEARTSRAQLAGFCPDWSMLPTMDGLAGAVEAGRRDLSATDERRRAVESSLHETSERILRLEHYAGLLDPRLGTVAEHVEGRLLATRFDELAAHDAASAQARLGIWTEAIVVATPEHAARQAAELSDRPDTLLFVSEQAMHGVQEATSLDDCELIIERLHGQKAARLTRRPKHPVLGRRARELEIARLRVEREKLERELAQLRERSRVLKEGLRVAERLLALGPAVWARDPQPALMAEQANIRALTQAIAELQVKAVRLREAAADTTRLRQRLVSLEARRSLLDPPDYAQVVARLGQQLEAARSARDWVGCHAAAVSQVLDGLPILAKVVEEGRRQQLEHGLEQYRRSRDRVAHQREAITKLLSVIAHLDREEEEKNYLEKTSVIAALQAQLAPAKVRMGEAGLALRDRRAQFDAARTAFADASAAVSQIAERCKALGSELARTGVQGTDEEVALARQAYESAGTGVARLDSEYKATHESFIVQRTNLQTLQEKVMEQRKSATQQLSTVRFERRAQRELDRVVDQLSLRGRIDSELNRQLHFSTDSLINAFESSQSQQVLLLDRLKPWPDVVLDIKRIEGFGEPAGERRAVQRLRAWERVRQHIEQRIPRNLASADDPQVALAQMNEKMSELQRTLDAQEEDMRTRSSGLADGITARQRSARSLVLRLNRDLEQVSFGSIKGLQITLSYPDDMTKMLACLKLDNTLSLFDSGLPLEETLARLYQRETGGTILGARLFDYRNYLQLRLEVRRINGKWEATSDVSTGEAIGTGAAVLIMILRTWNEEANRISGSAGYAMQQILLDEANRLDEHALDTLTEFCQRMDVQALVAAPGLDKPRRSTVFQLSRSLRGGKDESVTIRGTRITE